MIEEPFKFNKQKAIEAIVYVASKRPSVGYYNLMKIIFEADKSHLNKWGRPVTGDVFIAMEYGTVPSNIYDILKDPASSDPEIFVDSLQYIVSVGREPNLDLLSESDIEALDAGITKYADLNFKEVYDLNHKEVCWNTTKRNQKIPLQKMIENPEVLEELEEDGPFRIAL